MTPGLTRRPPSVILAAVLLTLTACGGAPDTAGTPTPPATAPGTTAQATVDAFLTAWEAGDGAALTALCTPDFRSLWAYSGGPSKWISEKRYWGRLVPGQGRRLNLQQTGATAWAQVGAIYDCSVPNCPSPPAIPSWGAPGSYAGIEILNLEREPDARWLLTYVKDSFTP